MAALRAPEPSIPTMALEMAVLTACRSGGRAGHEGTEIDYDTGTPWTIPAERWMKRQREHEVPLSADAVALIKRLEPARIANARKAVPVFPGRFNILSIDLRHGVDAGPASDRAQSWGARHGLAARMASARRSGHKWPTGGPVLQRRGLSGAQGRQRHRISRNRKKSRISIHRRKVMSDWAAFLSG